ncbi:MAG TPA: SAM-dependent chlorinase/fluorinase [Anaerolineae bacterium]|nr:SAM-dependent chlorinase/fluorinase [Anaerolineae bacterium]
MTLITLTTDFGLQDTYVGVMKGVIAGIAPGVPCIDLTHTIPAQDVQSAAYWLWTALPYFPPDSIHLAVVDPGVGTERRALAAQTAWGIVVGPDNGVFSYVWEAAPPRQIVALENPAYRLPAPSATFHGRDVFAPAAAHLARGIPLTEFGPPISDPVKLPAPHLESDEQSLAGAVIAIDHFGNAITSIGRLVWNGGLLRLDPAFGQGQALTLNPARMSVHVAGRDLGLVRHTYADASAGAPLALIGSAGMLEIAVNRGHAVHELGVTLDTPVVLRTSRDEGSGIGDEGSGRLNP